MWTEGCGNERSKATEEVEKSQSTELFKISFWCFNEAELANYTTQSTEQSKMANVSSPCVRAGRQSLGFCILFSPHSVPTGAEQTRPSTE